MSIRFCPGNNKNAKITSVFDIEKLPSKYLESFKAKSGNLDSNPDRAIPIMYIKYISVFKFFLNFLTREKYSQLKFWSTQVLRHPFCPATVFGTQIYSC